MARRGGKKVKEQTAMIVGNRKKTTYNSQQTEDRILVSRSQTELHRLKGPMHPNAPINGSQRNVIDNCKMSKGNFTELNDKGMEN